MSPVDRQALRHRLDPLSDGCRQLLTTASMIGIEFSAAGLGIVSGLPPGPIAPLLAEARAARFIAELPGRAGCYIFPEPAIREALYRGAMRESPSEQREGPLGRDSVFRQEGDFWTIAYEGDLLRLQDTKGLRYISLLLRNPGRKLPAGDLVAATQGKGTEPHRARMSVTKAIRSAIGRIARFHAPLAQHLQATIKTGTYCSYTPDPRVPTAWRA